MTGPDDIDGLAAEYVLGTLDAAERTAVAARRQREPELAAAIQAWERRLGPLAGLAPAVPAPAGLLPRIEARLDQSPASSIGASLAAGVATADVVALQRRLGRWRTTAIASGALAASLMLALGVREYAFRPPSQQFVAVFQKDDVLPAFLMSIDLATREVTIRPVDAERRPDRSYQLWILAEPLGPVPKSLGLLTGAAEPTRTSLAQFEPALLQNATFGISVEPPGGSPTGRPTGVALHAKLHPAAP